MNVTTLPNALPERLLARLAELPEFEPPPGGFGRVLARRRAQRRRRAGLALAAGVGALALLAGLATLAPRISGDAPVAARTQALEADVLGARPAVATPPITALEGELARLDAALQSAYDRGAAPGEIDRLWQARSATLTTLAAAYRHPDTIVRI